MMAVILLSVSLLFIALCHLFTASFGVCSFSQITLSHLSTQMRCAASEIIIWRSLDTPLILMENLLLLSSCLFRFPEFAVRHLHSRIVPRLDLELAKELWPHNNIRWPEMSLCVLLCSVGGCVACSLLLCMVRISLFVGGLER